MKTPPESFPVRLLYCLPQGVGVSDHQATISSLFSPLLSATMPRKHEIEEKISDHDTGDGALK